MGDQDSSTQKKSAFYALTKKSQNEIAYICKVFHYSSSLMNSHFEIERHDSKIGSAFYV